MKKILLPLFLLLSLGSSFSAHAVSIIPEVNEQFRSNYSCTIIIKEFEQLYDFGFKSGSTLISEQAGNITDSQADTFIANDSPNRKFTCATKELNNYLTATSDQKKSNYPKECNTENLNSETTDFEENDILGCSIITGRIRFAYLPRFIVYSLELLTILSGVLSLLFVILGGYYYLINSLAGSDTDKGKSYIKNAIIGLIVSLSAWSVINLVQLFFTT